MRKIVLAFMALGLISVSCSKDDEPENNSGCESCTAVGEKVEICPSKSGSLEKTYTILSGGTEVQTITQSDLDDLGITPKQYVQNLCDYENEKQ